MTANDVIVVARKFIGYHEKATNAYLESFTANAGSGNFTIFAKMLDDLKDFYNGPKNGFAWCDVGFDAWVYLASGKNKEKTMYVLCQPQRSAGAGCYYSAQYYKQAGRWSTKPVVGAQIFFTYKDGEVSHTGLVEAISGNTVVTIEGNTSDQVARRTYNVYDSHIYGYGLPRYDEVGADAVTTSPEDPISIPTDPEWITQNVPLPVLRKGCFGNPVGNAQALLIAHGYYCGGKVVNGHEIPDSDFGEKTDAAVRRFQELCDMKQDGEIGYETWLALIMR